MANAKTGKKVIRQRREGNVQKQDTEVCCAWIHQHRQKYWRNY